MVNEVFLMLSDKPTVEEKIMRTFGVIIGSLLITMVVAQAAMAMS